MIRIDVGRLTAGGMVLAGLLTFMSGAPAAQTPQKWWPSEWGAEDQLGALNRLTPAKVLEAAALIHDGTIYDMTRVYEESMPLFNLTPATPQVHAGDPWGADLGPDGQQ